MCQVTEVYQERRLDAVFGMWDQNNDLRISFKELCDGLFRYALASEALISHSLEGKLITKSNLIHNFGAAVCIKAKSVQMVRQQAKCVTAHQILHADFSYNSPCTCMLSKFCPQRLGLSPALRIVCSASQQG